ncbi:PilN domain-containing protein [Azovibrio restrictus]|uniref:PilN domain-containing protein n=1 Tax=Azovibrio restrictus TaxID=146938 RepID=UPI0026EBF320|nr:PilN domain-containing protein [Azovibrio restrictus]MDD3482772.1 PilN domain-containing protein [Azovibrio restrictus]
MIRINLLPHREEARKARRQQFYSIAGMVVVLSGLVVFLGYTIIDGYIQHQESRNTFLQSEIAVLDKQVEEIKRLKEQSQALLDRKNAIESLQKDRGETVYLLSELVRQTPEGIYLKGLKQTGAVVTVTGYAQSNSRVSTLMRNVEASEWMEAPRLIEIKAVMVAGRRLNEFSMDFRLVRNSAEGQIAKGERKDMKEGSGKS